MSNRTAAQAIAEQYALKSYQQKCNEQLAKDQRHDPLRHREAAKAQLVQFLEQQQATAAVVTLPGGPPMYVRRQETKRIADVSVPTLMQAIDSITWADLCALKRCMADNVTDQLPAEDTIREFVHEKLQLHHTRTSHTFDVTTTRPRSGVPKLAVPPTHVSWVQQFLEAKTKLKELRIEQHEDPEACETQAELQECEVKLAAALRTLPPDEQSVAIPLLDNGQPVNLKLKLAADATAVAASSAPALPPVPALPTQVRWTTLRNSFKATDATATGSARFQPVVTLVAAVQPQASEADMMNQLSQIKSLLWPIVLQAFEAAQHAPPPAVASAKAKAKAKAKPLVQCRKLPTARAPSSSARATSPNMDDPDSGAVYAAGAAAASGPPRALPSKFVVGSDASPPATKKGPRGRRHMA